jgi:phosphotransferase system HPr-like phosphotransfer protein
MNIKLNLVSDVYAFIDAAQKHPSEVISSQGTYVVDGKSILGIFALNLRESVRCNVADGDYSNFERFADR